MAMEYKFDLELTLEGEVIIYDLECIVEIDIDQNSMYQGYTDSEWSPTGYYVSSVNGKQVKANAFIRTQMEDAIREREHKANIDQAWEVYTQGV